MPVKIKAVDDPQDPRVITLEDYETGRANFIAHYFLDGCNTEFGGQDIQIAWKQFHEAINGFITTNKVEPATVALRFVYAYETETTNMCLRMQVCTMVQSQAVPNTFDLVTDKCAWFGLRNNEHVVKAKDTSLADPVYLKNFYYCEAETCTTDSCQNLDADKPLYARTITFPWVSEVFTMYKDNGMTGDGYICFGACSYVNGGDGDAPVMYPHGLVMYLKNEDGVPLLDNEDEMVLFHNKGCDMGTLCPSVCNVYVVPV